MKTDSIHIFVRLSVTINRTSIHLDKQKFPTSQLKETKSVTMNTFRKIFFSFLFKSFVKVELSYVFTIKMLSTAENCMEK